MAAVPAQAKRWINAYLEDGPAAEDDAVFKSVEVKQQADDGSDRLAIRGSDGTVAFESYFDGTDVILNPLVGDFKLEGVVDLNGNALKDDSRGFVEIGSSEDLRLGSGQSVTYPDDAGAETLADFSVTGTPAANTEESLAIDIDGTTIAKFYAEADGGGGLQNTQARFVDGDISNPGIAFENDPDTGLRRSGANTLTFTTGGDDEMELTSGGNLNLEGTLTESTTV